MKKAIDKNKKEKFQTIGGDAPEEDKSNKTILAINCGKI